MNSKPLTECPNFTLVSNDEINDIIRTAPSKHCDWTLYQLTLMKEHKRYIWLIS